MNKAPVGVFDSGLGGLSVMKAIRSLMPNEDLLYFADCAYAPYGDRSSQYIIERSESITRELLLRGVKALVVACNTATATAVNDLRSKFSLPIIGIEPAVKPAAAASKTRAIGVLATTRTLTSERYRDLVKRYAQDSIKVVSVPCPGLMECVEAGAWESPHTLSLIHKYLDPIRKANADQIVLGCTHYPFLTKQIQTLAPAGITIIDPSLAVAKELRHRLSLIDGLNETDHEGSERFLISGEAENHRSVVELLWNRPVQLESIRD